MSNRLLAAAAAISILCGTAAWAQPQPGSDPVSAPATHMQEPVARHAERCGNHYARVAAGLAFLEAKLNLTEAQRTPWNAWRQARLDDAAKVRDTCVADVPAHPDTPPTVLEREAHREKAMSARLAGLEARRPALEALYAVLTPDQKATFDHLADGHRHHHWRHDVMMERHGD